MGREKEKMIGTTSGHYISCLIYFFGNSGMVSLYFVQFILPKYNLLNVM